MPKIIWDGCQKWDKDYPEEPLPENAVKMEQDEHYLWASLKYAVLPMIFCFLLLFLKRWAIQDFPMDRGFIFLGILLGLVLIPLHEGLHAVCFPKNATVYMGLCPKKFAAFTVCHFPIAKRRFIVMSLLPALLGVIPLALFCIFPGSWKIAAALLWPAGTIGLLSPSPDYMDVAHFQKQVPKGAFIQSKNDGWYWFMK
jgi:hypothetical protein